MMTEVPTVFDLELLNRRKARAAPGANTSDFLLRHVGEEFAFRLDFLDRRFHSGANIGAFHGVLSRRLLETGRVASFTDLEPCDSLLAQCTAQRVKAPIEILPFAPGSFDLAVSGFALGFVNDLPGVLAQIRRALSPGGLFLAALPGPSTLKELREAWLVAESELKGGASPRVAPFVHVRMGGSLLQRAGFARPVADADTLTVTYDSPLALMQDLKAMGASNMLAARRCEPVTRALLVRAAEVYLERFAQDDGRVPATFEIITLTGSAPV